MQSSINNGNKMTIKLYTLTEIWIATKIRGRKVKTLIEELDITFNCKLGISPRFFLSLKEAREYQENNSESWNTRSYNFKKDMQVIRQHNTTFEINSLSFAKKEDLYNVLKPCRCGCKDDFLRAFEYSHGFGFDEVELLTIGRPVNL